MSASAPTRTGSVSDTSITLASGSDWTRVTSRATPRRPPSSSTACTLVSASGWSRADSRTRASASPTLAMLGSAMKSIPISPPALVLLPPGQRTKVLTLMGFNSTSAGGLMGMDFIALPSMATVSDALARVREAVMLQPEALTSVHAVDDDGGLRGVARLVTLVQSDPGATVIDVSDTDPVRVGAD